MTVRGKGDIYGKLPNSSLGKIKVLNKVIDAITSLSPSIRNQSVEDLLTGKHYRTLFDLARELEIFLSDSENLYHRVRACLFLSMMYRFYIPGSRGSFHPGVMFPAAVSRMLNEDWEEALRLLRPSLKDNAPDVVLSAAAAAYYRLSFKFLLDQVLESISQMPENEWLFQSNSLDNYPLTVPREYLIRDKKTGLYPLGFNSCPVRIDPCHSGWSDIFFLAMDYPEGARVINFSVDIARKGENSPRPPIECYSRIIDRGVIRLVSLDLGCTRNIYSTIDLFDFNKDRLGLLKAGIIAAGVIPPYLREDPSAIGKILRKLLGPGRGIELVTKVHDLPPGSRLAVSTTLLATIITRLMRQTGQFKSRDGNITEKERRIVASRAILGEWLGGSGGGWQDTGGIWPGIKVISGVSSGVGDPEYGRSRGRLLPDYRIFTKEELPPRIDEILRNSIILVHGGLSRDVGPILEMATEKYLLRFRKEWEARLRASQYFDEIVDAIRQGNMAELGRMTTRDWNLVTKKIIPWASDAYTEELIERIQEHWRKDYYGFLMLGGQAGGGMAFIINPAIHNSFLTYLEEMMCNIKHEYENALPFAMEPSVFDFTLNHKGIGGDIFTGDKALLPEEYYRLIGSETSFNPMTQHQIPSPGEFSLARRKYTISNTMISPVTLREHDNGQCIKSMPSEILSEYDFNSELHRRNKELYQSGIIGLRENRFTREKRIKDADLSEVLFVPKDDHPDFPRWRALGETALRRGEAGVVTFGAGLGSRWSGVGVVKLISPFVMIKGRHRSFLEIHLAKSSKTGYEFGYPIQHVFTTSFLTHRAIENTLTARQNYGFPGEIYLSHSLSTIQRLYPTEGDIREFARTDLRKITDPESRRQARLRLSRLVKRITRLGPGEEFVSGPVIKRFYPAGHWYEIPNLIRNGTLSRMLSDNPNLRHLLVHNTDTLGASLNPVLLGMHICSNNPLSFEVLPRLWGDRGGFLARVDGRNRIVEAGALPRVEDEVLFTFYNSLTTWINIDKFLSSLWLSREEIIRSTEDSDIAARVEASLFKVEQQIPVYVTLKNTEYFYCRGQSELAPVVQCERLWGDITGIPSLATSFIAVERNRGRQLKDPATLDNWIRDGALDYLSQLTLFNNYITQCR